MNPDHAIDDDRQYINVVQRNSNLLSQFGSSNDLQSIQLVNNNIPSEHLFAQARNQEYNTAGSG